MSVWLTGKRRQIRYSTAKKPIEPALAKYLVIYHSGAINTTKTVKHKTRLVIYVSVCRDYRSRSATDNFRMLAS